MIKDRNAFALLVLIVSGLVAGGWLLWCAYQSEPRAEPPLVAFVYIGIAIVALWMANLGASDSWS